MFAPLDVSYANNDVDDDVKESLWRKGCTIEEHVPFKALFGWSPSEADSQSVSLMPFTVPKGHE